eukprot:CAMPEP_0172513242 /NCGR_PEP_ID=MMETSP1066-20121228/250958_1 /TAXON_ID=671091 /ORGANISM="Coscinodiscus wailesii, Strain CCMP2513" /LENGTH=190 /DNA_ID=CAMNT_0013293425 /DNA_START=130 /DNA_END=699 /DNA_ORIENTATION=+
MTHFIFEKKRDRFSTQNKSFEYIKLMDHVLEPMKRFISYDMLKKLALLVIAHKLTSQEIADLRKAFDAFDLQHDGIISFGEFREALSCYGYPKEVLKRLFNGINIDNTGLVNYTEFLAATIEGEDLITEGRIAEAFDHLDCNNSGYISFENINEQFEGKLPSDKIEKIIAEVAVGDNENKICYAEFLLLW